jgi:hypothetical protein
MRTLLAVATGAILLLAANLALAQNGSVMDGGMMNGGMWGMGWMGGYGGLWVPVLLVVLVIALLAWGIKRKSK